MECIPKIEKNFSDKKWRFFIVFIVVILLFLFCTVRVQADNVTLKVGYSDCDPIFLDEKGNYNGYAVSYLEEISRYTGWEYEYISDSWENCLKRLEEGELDLLVMAHRTLERNEQFLFSDLPMGYDYPVLYAASDSGIFYQDYISFTGSRIGVSSETSFENTLQVYLEELDLECEIVTFDTDEKAREAVMNGAIDMMVSSTFTPQKDMKVVDRFGAAPGYILTNLEKKDLIKDINSAMQKIRIHNPNLEDILMRTFYSVSKDITNLYLTREEQEYIENVGPILIKGFEDRRPLGFTDKNGEFRGIMVDYLNYIGEMCGLEFVYEASKYHGFIENIPAMKSQGFGLLWAGDTVEDMGLTNVIYHTDPLFDTALAYIRRQGEYVTKYDRHTFVVSTDMHHVEDLLLETNMESKVLYYESAKDCMDAVLKGKAEMAILSDKVAEYWLQKPVYNNKLTRVAGSGAYIYGMRLYVTKEHRHLVSIINKTLEHISDTQKLYMLDNMALSYEYTQQWEDILYENEEAIMISGLLLLLLIGMIIRYRIAKEKGLKKEAFLLKEQIKRSEDSFRLVSEHSNRTLYIYDLKTKTTKPWDEENAKKDILAHVYIQSYSEENLEKNTAVFTEKKDDVKNFFSKIHSGIPSGEMKVRIRLLDGKLRWYHFKYSNIYQEGKPISAMISIDDITEQHEHELAYLRIKKTLEDNVPGNLISIEINLTLDRVEKIYGIEEITYSEEQAYTVSELMREVISQNILFIKREEALEYFSIERLRLAYDKGERHLHTEWQIRFPEGTEHWLDTNITLMEDPYNQDIKMFVWMRNITEEKIRQIEIRERSEKDAMTGVYNRKTAEDLICKSLRDDSKGMFLIVDMDKLKQINDVHGHKEGDKAIKGMAQIIKSHFRTSDIIGRIGGDEFIIYLPGASDNREVMSAIFQKLLKRLNSFMVGENSDIPISCSMGCTIEQEGSTYESLYQQADIALYYVKRNGRNNFAFYSPGMEEVATIEDKVEKQN